MEWWSKVVCPLRNICCGVACRLRFRKRGLVKLRRDVRACEYEDVHVMWEMLRRTEAEHAGCPDRRKSPFWKIFGWARSAPCLGCRI